MIYELKEPSNAAPLFGDWDDTGITVCLDGLMGNIYVTDPDCPRSVLAVAGDFAYCAGEPDEELLKGKPDRWMLIVPQNEEWAELIENCLPASKRIRYAIRKDTVFDREKLEAMVRSLPEGYVLRRIDGELYDMCMGNEEFRDNVAVFGSMEKFLEYGRGFAVMKDGMIVSAASSYFRSLKEIDIEIGTVKQERHRGLASAAAAKLILECLDEGLYPAWDAANKMSVRLAEKLGYEYAGEYVCYGVD